MVNSILKDNKDRTEEVLGIFQRREVKITQMAFCSIFSRAVQWIRRYLVKKQLDHE